MPTNNEPSRTPRRQCGKCDSNDLLKVPTTPSDHSHIVVGERLMHDVPVCRYVCTDCGHVEEWIADHADLDRLKQELRRQASRH